MHTGHGAITRVVVLYVLLIALVIVAASMAANAQTYHRHGMISVSQADREALRWIPGSVLGRTVLENINGRLVYRVNVRTSYGRRAVFVDAYSGRIISIERTVVPSTGVYGYYGRGGYNQYGRGYYNRGYGYYGRGSGYYGTYRYDRYRHYHY